MSLTDGFLLTPRQREVLCYIANGHTPRQAARAMFISYHTILAHLRDARERLGAATTTQAVVLALQTNQIPETDL